jgi:hypothetical protein
MIRTLNFTGRKRIPREAAKITLHRDAELAVAFDAALDFNGLVLPPDARVFVEAAFKTTFIRFDWGTVAKPMPPEDRRLSRLGQPALAHFRVKVVEPVQGRLGRLIAVAFHLAPEGLRGEEKRRVSLFRVNIQPGTLADEVWRLDIDPPDGAGPILELNPQISGIKELTRQEAFMALVFPNIVRQVFARIFGDGNDDATCDRDSWQSRWLRFGGQFAKRPNPPLADGKPEDAHTEWIDEVVSEWSRRQKLVSNFKKRFAGTEVMPP